MLVSDRDAVLQAIAEFDELGREAFLAKYGFGKSREFFLVHANRDYDSKAIVAAAHGYTKGNQRPLLASEFSGGEATVQKSLEALGFTVIRRPKSTDGAAWTRDELFASVTAYLQIRDARRRGSNINMAEIYRELSERFGRTPKAFEYRMQNISYVLSVTGREWVQGLKPAKNVGTNTAAEIEGILAEIEGRAIDPNVAFETQVTAAVSRGAVPKPQGNKAPKKSTGGTTVFERDPMVKAWVLLEAKGKCECCKRPAPFTTPQGPFLEVHHVKRLADGGPDTIDNAVAICPNCHRELHHGINAAALVKSLYITVSRLRRY